MPIRSRQQRAQCRRNGQSIAPRALAASVAVWVVILIGNAAGATVIACADAAIAPGGVGTLRVWLRTDGVAIAGVQNDLNFPAGLHVVGGYHCDANPAIDKNYTAFASVPRDCGPGDCGWMRALVLSLQNVDPIPDGALLYTCAVAVDANVRPGIYPVHVVNAGASTPQGEAVWTRGVDCAVYVSTAAGPAPAHAPEPAARPISVPTAAAKPAAVPSAAWKPAATRAVFATPLQVTMRPTPTATPRTGAPAGDSALTRAATNGGGGCQVAIARSDDRSGAPVRLALAAIVALLRARRRRDRRC